VVAEKADTSGEYIDPNKRIDKRRFTHLCKYVGTKDQGSLAENFRENRKSLNGRTDTLTKIFLFQNNHLKFS